MILDREIVMKVSWKMEGELLFTCPTYIVRAFVVSLVCCVKTEQKVSTGSTMTEGFSVHSTAIEWP